MATFIQDVSMDGQAKSSLMSVAINHAEAKRRCVEATHTHQWKSGVRTSLFRLRGVRVAEASKPTSPGSPDTGFNRRSSGYFGARVVELD